MKKLVVVLMALMVLSGAVFAAGGAQGGGKVTLKMWESEGVEKDFMLWAAAEFKKLYPNVTVTYEPVGSVDARAKIELDGPAGVGGDIFVAPHDHMGALINGGHVLENPMNLAADFVDAAVTASTYQGKAYGYPLAIESIALFYNKDLVKTPPKTWDEIIAFARTFNNPSQMKYALVWEVGNAYVNYMFMHGFGAPLFGPAGDDRNQHNIDSAGSIAGLRYFQSLRKQLLDVPQADVTGDFCNSSFIEGNAAMILTGPWKINDFTKANVNYGITTIPPFPGKTTPPNTFSGLRLAFVSAYTQHPEIAQAFAQFLVSKPVLEKRLEMTKQIPPRKDIDVKDPLQQGILAQAKFAVPMPAIPQMGTYWSAMGAAFGSIWDGADVARELGAAAAAMRAAR